MQVRRALIAAGAAGALLAAAGGTPATAAQGQGSTTAPTPRPLAWEECPKVNGIDPRQECVRVPVPLDYSAPGGRQIEIAVSRIQTATPSLRRGILVFNPGGPGSSGINGPTKLAATLPRAVLERYDLVGFDPRGIKYSAPVSCSLAPTDLDVLKFIPYPAHDLDIADNVAYARRTAAGCGATSGDLLPHITTANTARDMDQIRRSLGESKLSYIGYSYGTYLGSVYTTLFPQQTDRFVLDSNIHPRRIWRETFASWGYAVEVAFQGFARFAAAHDATYGLGGTPGAVHAKIVELALELEKEPFVHPAGIEIGGDAFRELIRNDGLRNDLAFPGLAELIALIDARDTTPASGRAVQGLLEQLGADGGAPAADGASALAFPTPAADNDFAAPWAVACGDADWPSSPDVYQRDVRAYDAAFPIHGRAAANIWPCAFWPTEPREAPVTVGPLSDGNVLLVQSKLDPATPYDGAVALRATLGNRSRLVSVETGAHSVSFNRINSCSDARVADFLTTGTLPARDATCERDAPLTPAAQQLTADRPLGEAGLLSLR